jgi:HAD superfamily hydrolase (TIGR01509 family)
MKPEAILFDAGGTLILQDHARLSSVLEHPLTFDDAFEAHYWAMDAYARRRIAGEEISWTAWQDDFFGRIGLAEPRRGAELTNDGYGYWSVAIPGAIEMVENLDVRKAVISNSDGSVTDSLREAGFDGLFEFVIDSFDVGVAKPKPEIFLTALERMGLAPEQVWYVGDSLFHDIGGAKAAGLAAGVLIDPFELAPEYEPRLRSVTELPALLGET